MSFTLHFGVADVPYGSAYQAATSKRPGPHPGPAQQIAMNRTTTGDVAEILEARYGIMQRFFELHEAEIVRAVEEVIEDKLEALLSGRPIEQGLFQTGDFTEIEQAFRKMLDDRELDGRVPGVPTQASLQGVSHRMKHPYAKRGPRPSVIDTGLYQATFRVWR